MVPATTILLASTLFQHAFAALFITGPIGTTTGHGGQSLTVSWNDDNTQPDLKTIGPCSIGIFAGNPQQQTQLQAVSPSVDVSKQSSLSFTVDASIGPNSKEYFIRFASLGLKDPKNPQFNYESFSAKFALDGMTGKFSAAVQSQIDGVTSAAAGPTKASSILSSTPTISSSSAPSALSTIATSSKPTTTSTAKPSSAALPMYNSHISSLVGLVAMLFGILV